MSTINDTLRPHFLVGTRGGAALTLPDEVASLVPEDAAPEATLLHAAGVMTLRELAGFEPTSATPGNFQPAPPDTRAACNAAAAAVLDDVLETGEPALLAEWLDLAEAADVRAPHRLIPVLLDRARRDRSLRPRIDRAVDERGRWLAEQNPEWQTVAAASDLDEVWQTGTREQRVVALRQRRREDAAAGHAMVESTWSQDGAADRAAFVAALDEGLSMGDEPWLEDRLDDRSKQVREAAAHLLVGLPESRLVHRMKAALRPLISATGKEASVELPASFDPAWQRDGLVEKPSHRQGQRQWWVQQLGARVPPTFWSETTGLPADAIIAPRTDGGWQAALAGIAEANNRHPTPAFADALVQTPKLRDLMSVEGLRAVSSAVRVKLLKLAGAESVGTGLWQLWAPLSPDEADALLAAARARMKQFAWLPNGPALACALPLASLGRLLDLVDAGLSSQYNPDRIRHTVALRQQMHRAFTQPT